MTATVPACPECGRRCHHCLTKIAAAGVGNLPRPTPAAASSDDCPPRGIERPRWVTP